MNKFNIIMLLSALFTLAAPSLGFAGEPVDWQLGLQPAASSVAEHINSFHNLLLYIIFAIAIFVLLLLVWVIIRYNEKANPEPAQFSHNVFIEVIWTVIPVIILIIIAIPSFKLLYYSDRVENPEMTLKVIGRQWYWDYEYPDHGDIAFSSYMIADEDIDESKGEVRLLSTDTKVVLPIDTTIEILIEAGDVLHSWTIPAFGVKMDAVPGRINSTWVRIDKPGVYYGQCSELCGKDHAYMPIEVHAVTKEEFEAWVEKAKEEFASMDRWNNRVTLASIQN